MVDVISMPIIVDTTVDEAWVNTLTTLIKEMFDAQDQATDNS